MPPMRERITCLEPSRTIPAYWGAELRLPAPRLYSATLGKSRSLPVHPIVAKSACCCSGVFVWGTERKGGNTGKEAETQLVPGTI